MTTIEGMIRIREAELVALRAAHERYPGARRVSEWIYEVDDLGQPPTGVVWCEDMPRAAVSFGDERCRVHVTRRTMFHDPRALLAVVASRHEAAVLDVLK